MTTLIDSQGRELPALETPSDKRLRTYGDLLFLAFRSPRHAVMPVGMLRRYFEPPVELGQYRIFRFDEVPRGMFTWAMLGPEAEHKLIAGDALEPADWRSGNNLWIVDMIAPYRGLAKGIGRWIMQPGNVTERDFYFRRVEGANNTRRILHVDFRKSRKARILGDADFLDA